MTRRKLCPAVEDESLVTLLGRPSVGVCGALYRSVSAISPEEASSAPESSFAPTVASPSSGGGDGAGSSYVTSSVFCSFALTISSKQA